MQGAVSKRGCNTQGSHVITHRSTNWACRCLTSQIGRDGVLSPEYGRIRCRSHPFAAPCSVFRSIEVSIPACHAGDPGSIPGGRVFPTKRRRQDSNLRGQSPVDFWSTPLTAWVRLLLRAEICHLLGLNQGPSDLQSDALPTELKRLAGNKGLSPELNPGPLAP